MVLFKASKVLVQSGKCYWWRLYVNSYGLAKLPNLTHPLLYSRVPKASRRGGCRPSQSCCQKNFAFMSILHSVRTMLWMGCVFQSQTKCSALVVRGVILPWPWMRGRKISHAVPPKPMLAPQRSAGTHISLGSSSCVSWLSTSKRSFSAFRMWRFGSRRSLQMEMRQRRIMTWTKTKGGKFTTNSKTTFMVREKTNLCIYFAFCIMRWRQT